jgi:hypothetical protein
MRALNVMGQEHRNIVPRTEFAQRTARGQTYWPNSLNPWNPVHDLPVVIVNRQTVRAPCPSAPIIRQWLARTSAARRTHRFVAAEPFAPFSVVRCPKSVAGCHRRGASIHGQGWSPVSPCGGDLVSAWANALAPSHESDDL